MESQRESLRARRAAELEEKKRKLEELRKRKAQIRSSDDRGPGTRETKEEHKLDDFIESILRNQEQQSQQQQQQEVAVGTAADHELSQQQQQQTYFQSTLSLAEKLSSLSTVTNVSEVHILPAIVETYTKHVQTEVTLEDFDQQLTLSPTASHLEQGTDTAEPMEIEPLGQLNEGTSTASLSPSKAARKGMASPSGSPSRDQQQPAINRLVLAEEDKKKLLESKAMELFLTKASRFVERALTSNRQHDFMVDYSAFTEKNLSSAEPNALGLKQAFVFKDDKWTRGRAVTDVDMSPFHPELLLTAYTCRNFLFEEDKDVDMTGAAPQEDPNDPCITTDGVVLLWSTALPTRPEYRFTCHAQVTSACFNPFDRYLIFGGTYTGQVVVWDLRSKQAPVQKTSLSTVCHTHPIYSMTVVGTKNSYSLVSASTDGRVCIWSVEQLQQPMDVLDLRISCSINTNYSLATVNVSTSDKKIEAAVTCLALDRKETREMFIGTETGKLYSTRLEQQKAKAAVGAAASGPTTSGGVSGAGPSDASELLGSGKRGLVREVIVSSVGKDNQSHFGVVTAMHFNPLLPVHREKGLLLSASLDSSVKLWSMERPDSPVFTFEPSSEYICDVRWSCVHPALFAVVDSNGKIFIWNVCKDIEMPVVEVQVSNRALNKIRWATDGKSVVVGDADGNTWIYEIQDEIALPNADDLYQLETKITAAIGGTLSTGETK